MSKCIPWIVHTAKYNNLLKTSILHFGKNIVLYSIDVLIDFIVPKLRLRN